LLARTSYALFAAAHFLILSHRLSTPSSSVLIWHDIDSNEDTAVG
jgi:hypothetical protein